jgi:ATP-dependent protease ClpP protease subunit
MKKDEKTAILSVSARTEPQENEPEETSSADPAISDGAVTVGAGNTRIHCLTVIGQVEGHYQLGGGQKSTQYEHLIPDLVSAEEDDSVAGLLVILNTVGGDVEAGLALAELIASMKKPTCSLVLGGGHSIGVPLAVSADRSFIVPTATMTLHPVRMNGLVIGVPQTYAYFSKMQERIVSFVTAHSRCDAETLDRLIMSTDSIAADMGTIIDGREAVEYGIIDEIGGLAEAMAFLRGNA